jgi:ketosteroid isomerase-like protein
MTTRATQLIERFYESLNAKDVEAVVDLYDPDALVIRFTATSRGPSEISEFYSDVLAKHGDYELHSLDQITESGDVLMWDALVTTANGIIETTEVLVLDDAGMIRRHIPGFRGYWGK